MGPPGKYRDTWENRVQKGFQGSRYSHLVTAFVQPGTWEVEGLLGSNVPVASKVLPIDEYNPLFPAL